MEAQDCQKIYVSSLEARANALSHPTPGTQAAPHFLRTPEKIRGVRSRTVVVS